MVQSLACRMNETAWELSIDAAGVPGGIDELPAHIDARRWVLRIVHGPHRPEELAAAIESDPALLARVLRRANALDGRGRTIGSAAHAVLALGPRAIADVAERTPVQDPRRRLNLWGAVPQRYREHVAAVRAVADGLARDAEAGDRGELTAAIVLHDIGRLALLRAEPAYERIVAESASPEDRVCAERGLFGIDHAELGGWLARRWGLPERLAMAIEGHHGDRLGVPALIRLADMLVHAREGQPVDLGQLTETVAIAGVSPSRIRAIAFEPTAA
jgi:HD-like signal output (HDOD) protein